MNSIHIKEIEESADTFRSLSASAAELVNRIRKALYEADENETVVLSHAVSVLEKYAANAAKFAQAADKACGYYRDTEKKIIAVYNEEEILYPRTMFARSHFDQLEKRRELMQISDK